MFEDLKEYALINHIPIVKDAGLEVLVSLAKDHNISTCLEIGTAIGYSAIRLASEGLMVVTIEREPKMFSLAVNNIKKYHLEDKIKVVLGEALEYTPNDNFDLIFIDAAKSQNLKFFMRFEPYIKKDGYIVVDNLNFHGLVDMIEPKSRNLREMVRKIREFREWLSDNQKFETVFSDAGDGMSVSRKK